MEGISLTSRSASWRMENVAKLLALKAAECVQSMRALITLGVLAFVSLLAYFGTGESHGVLAVPCVVWVLQLCLWLTLDILKGGEEL